MKMMKYDKNYTKTMTTQWNLMKQMKHDGHFTKNNDDMMKSDEENQ